MCFFFFFFLIFFYLFRDSKSFSYPGGFCLFNDTLFVAVYCVHSWSFGLGITNRKYFILKGVASRKGTHDAFNLSWNSKSNCKNSQNKWRRKRRVSFYFVEYCKETLELTLADTFQLIKLGNWPSCLNIVNFLTLFKQIYIKDRKLLSRQLIWQQVFHRIILIPFWIF